MNKCEHTDCFANTNGKCHALSPTPQEKCPFYKSVARLELERRKTEQRLYNLGGVKK